MNEYSKLLNPDLALGFIFFALLVGACTFFFKPNTASPEVGVGSYFKMESATYAFWGSLLVALLCLYVAFIMTYQAKGQWNELIKTGELQTIANQMCEVTQGCVKADSGVRYSTEDREMQITVSMQIANGHADMDKAIERFQSAFEKFPMGVKLAMSSTPYIIELSQPSLKKKKK